MRSALARRNEIRGEVKRWLSSSLSSSDRAALLEIVLFIDRFAYGGYQIPASSALSDWLDQLDDAFDGLYAERNGDKMIALNDARAGRLSLLVLHLDGVRHFAETGGY